MSDTATLLPPDLEDTAPEVEDLAPVTAGGALAAGIASIGAAIALGSLFEGLAPAFLGAVGAAAGAGLMALSLRSPRAIVLQWLAGPLAVVLGVVAALTAGSGSSIPRLVRDALFSGGLAQPPVPFDPGWRFVLVVLTTLLGAGAASVALSTRRPNVGVGVTVPVVVLATVGQPPDAGPAAAIAGLVGVVGGLVVAYGVEVARADGDAGFQSRRVLRGLAAMGALGVGLAALASAASFLLPEPSETQVIPPQRPPMAEPQEDRELFVVDVERVLPWRLGVLDVYDDNAWMTPPFDVARFTTPPVGDTTGAIAATFTIRDLAGRTLPGLADLRAVDAGDEEIVVDPRTGALRLDRLATPGLSYTVTAAPPASTDQLVAVGRASAEFDEFRQVPPAPGEVQALLARATGGDFERLQAVRDAWYSTVVAAGKGDPVDVPPERVAAILRGDGNSEASPYEIVAGEALLARWVGLPSRIGYGWYGGDEVDGGRSIRPKHGSVWLEVYFDGPGWVPIVGRPPRAKGSLSDAPKNDDPGVQPTRELALITYVPIRRESFTLLFEVVRYWVVRVVPALLLLFLVVTFSPVARRAWRRWRWSRWAGANGPRAQLLVRYAMLRDRAWDLNIGSPAQTPLEFADAVRADDEHRELAWLVTRSLWGDLAATAADAEVDAVRQMSTSVTRRIVAAQPATARIIAAASRASLRQPYAPELQQAVTGRGDRWARLGRRRAVAAVAAVLLLGSCTQGVDLETRATVDVLPDPLVPARLDDVRLQREPEAEVPFEEGGPNSLVDHGRVYTVRVEDTIEASLQIAALRPGVRDRFEDVRDGILADLGGGRFRPIRIGSDSVLSVETNEQRLLLWFSPRGEYYQLLVARRSFDRADAVFGAVLATQRGFAVTSLDDFGVLERVDERRGIR